VREFGKDRFPTLIIRQLPPPFKTVCFGRGPLSSPVPVKKPVRKPSGTPATRSVPDGQGLLARILDTPHLAQVVPRLKPEVLHRVIQTCGLEDCGDLVAMVTPSQLQAVFDLDLWRPPRPGLDEQLDPARFGQWLDVLMESGAGVAAQKLAGVDLDLVVASFAQHLRVRDVAAASPFTTLDGELITPPQRPRGWQECEIGGYRLEAKRTEAWDAIVELLVFLDAEHAEFFHRVMSGCRRLSNSRPEEDAFHDLLVDTEQDMFDLAVDRDERREKQGYVIPAQARAFLQASRQLQLDASAPPPLHPIARAYFRAIEWTEEEPQSAAAESAPSEHAEALSTVVDALLDAGVLPGQPRGLLAGAHDDGPRLSTLQVLMQYANEHDPAAFSSRGGELAYLANTLVAGCSVQGRPFTASEASEAAAAICNLALENWSRYWPQPLAARALPDAFLIDHDLVSVFQVGWRILHADVCLLAADRLVDTLTGLRCDDGEIQLGVVALRAAMSRQRQAGTPWAARGAMDVIAILDTPAWAALLGLIDECPVLHGVITAAGRPGTRSISMSAFEFISGNDQLAAIHAFLDRLPSTLSG
jgi:hypothetical protein